MTIVQPVAFFFCLLLFSLILQWTDQVDGPANPNSIEYEQYRQSQGWD